MKKEMTIEQVKADIVNRSLAMITQRLAASKKNAKTVLALIEKIEADADLSSTDKKMLLGKIKSYYLLSTSELLELIDALSANSDSDLPEQICVTMADEVRKWAR